MTDDDKEIFIATEKLVGFIEENKKYIISEFETGGKELIRLSDKVLNLMIPNYLKNLFL